MSVTSSIAAPTPKNAEVSELQATRTRVVVTSKEQSFGNKSGASSASPNSLGRANPYSIADKANDSLAQVTSVSQLSDVQSTDLAFQALQSLGERYGCITGYTDSTYRGNRALTRYEFAADLNACLDRVNKLIATATADQVTKEDITTLQRLQEEFATEIASLGGRVGALETATAEPEANQFSTTTKLNGEVILAFSSAFGDNKAVPSGVPAGVVN